MSFLVSTKVNPKYSFPPLSETEVSSLKLSKEIYLHKEGDGVLESFPLHRLPISKCFHVHGNSVIDMLHGLTGYIVVPVYLDSYGKITDFQLAVTGSCLKPKFEKHSDTSAIREVHEEIGCNVNSNYIVRTRQVEGIYPDVNGFVKVIIPTSTPEPTSSSYKKINYTKKDDDHSRKVVVWYNIQNPSDVITRRRISSSDKAGVVVAIIPVSDIITLITKKF